MDVAQVTVKCTMCVTVINDDDFEVVTDEIIDKLELLKLSFEIETIPGVTQYVCKICSQRISNCFDFKLILINGLEPSVAQMNRQSIPSTSKDEIKLTLCYLCKNYVSTVYKIPLKKFIFDGMEDIFVCHISELNIQNVDENSMMCDKCHKSLVNFWCLVRLQEASDTLSDATDTCTWSPMDEDSPPETSGVPEKHKKDSSSSDSDETELKRMKTNISNFSEYRF